MQAAIACVGKIRDKHLRGAADEFLKRLSRFGKVEELEVQDLPEPENAGEALCRQVMEKEGERLLSRLKPGDHVITLCIGGKKYTSEGFAQRIQTLENQGKGRLVFVIGGSLGLSPAVLQRADETLSLSDMTFPHQLARVLLLEQIYRACKINHNERYHK